MQTTRVQVPVNDETRTQLQALADAQGCSLAAVCRDLLQEVAPMAAELAKSLRIAKQAPSRALREMTDVLDEHLAKADQLRLELGKKTKPRKYRKAG